LKIILAESEVPSMSKMEIDEFLTSQKIPMRLATIDSNGSPSIHPVWYYYAKDTIYMFTGKNRRKTRNLEQNPTVYFTIDTEAFPNKGVKGKAKARFIIDSNDAIEYSSKIVEKYLGTAKTGWGKRYDRQCKEWAFSCCRD
jgi:nitroimidazol reductase NimA-like FMN-containing flavoprotein (pyridoxamine 5'-phosphate oxidase superfamily)